MIYHFIAVFTDPTTQLKTAYHYSNQALNIITAKETDFANEFSHCPYTAHRIATPNASWRSVIEHDFHFKAVQVTESFDRIRQLVGHLALTQ